MCVCVCVHVWCVRALVCVCVCVLGWLEPDQLTGSQSTARVWMMIWESKGQNILHGSFQMKFEVCCLNRQVKREGRIYR